MGLKTMLTDPDFSGRAVLVWCKGPAGSGVLEDVSVQRLDQRAFLVGRLADIGKGGDPRIGATFWFPVDEVISLTVFADVRTAQAAYAATPKQATHDDPKNPKRRFWQ
jgi:hypothetical protein